MSARGSSTKAPSSKVFAALLVGTRTGAFILRGDSSRRGWPLSEPIFLGHIVHHLVLDPRDGETMLMACSTGHLGPTVFRSIDRGTTWTEAMSQPAFPKVSEGQTGLTVDHVFWLTPGHPSKSQVWYAGSALPAKSLRHLPDGPA